MEEDHKSYHERASRPPKQVSRVFGNKLIVDPLAFGDRHHLVAGGCWRGAVQALVLVASKAHVVADDVQRTHHLAEYQHPAGTAPVVAHISSHDAFGAHRSPPIPRARVLWEGSADTLSLQPH